MGEMFRSEALEALMGTIRETIDERVGLNANRVAALEGRLSDLDSALVGAKVRWMDSLGVHSSRLSLLEKRLGEVAMRSHVHDPGSFSGEVAGEPLGAPYVRSQSDGQLTVVKLIPGGGRQEIRMTPGEAERVMRQLHLYLRIP